MNHLRTILPSMRYLPAMIIRPLARAPALPILIRAIRHILREIGGSFAVRIGPDQIAALEPGDVVTHVLGAGRKFAVLEPRGPALRVGVVAERDGRDAAEVFLPVRRRGVGVDGRFAGVGEAVVELLRYAV